MSHTLLPSLLALALLLASCQQALAKPSCPENFTKSKKALKGTGTTHKGVTIDQCGETCERGLCKSFTFKQDKAWSVEDDMDMDPMEGSMKSRSVTGWLYDNMCWNSPNGIAADGTNVTSEAHLHSVMCLLMPKCVSSNFSLVDMDAASGTYKKVLSIDGACSSLVVKFIAGLKRPNNVRATLTGHDQPNGEFFPVKITDAVSVGTCTTYMTKKPLKPKSASGSVFCVKDD